MFFQTQESYIERREELRKKWNASKKYSEEYPLNEDQFSAVHVITTRASRPFPFVLNGPPGTGKTHTIATATSLITRQYPDHRVLICTPSNAAADRVAEKLITMFGKKGQKINEANVLRMVSSGGDYKKRDQALDCVM